jgi:hypothetical protein
MDLSPNGIAKSKRERMLAISDTEYQQWRHQPVTAGYLQYLDDVLAFMREAAADLLESGLFIAGDQHQDKNPDCLRGQMIMLRQLHGLRLDQIREFYRASDAHNEAGEING